MYKVVLLTSAHPRYDTRIFYKMCKSLAKKYDVNLIVADGQGDEIKENIKIFDVGKFNGRINRIINATKAVYKKAVELDADIYHLHDPELIPIGIKLKKRGKKVIFDIHEDVPKQILHRRYLPLFLLKLIGQIYDKYQKKTITKFDAVITATPIIKQKLMHLNENIVNINNYPILKELLIQPDWDNKKHQVCYIGSLGVSRGIKELILATKYLPESIKIVIGGKFGLKKEEKKIKTLKEWNNILFLDYLDRTEVKNVLKDSIAGIVTLYPTQSNKESLPVKMFEYMAAGLPVIASDFPLWKKIIKENNCGICVDPLDYKKIANTIQFLVKNKNLAKEIGKNAQKLILTKYNWEEEEKKLFSLYKKILKD